MTIDIIPLDAPLGARVEGFDFGAPCDAETHARLLAALDDRLALVFPALGEEPPPPDQVVSFCESFGPLRPTLADKSRLPGFPGINRVSNRDDGEVIGTGGNGLVTWHSDLSFTPPLIEFIYLDAVTVPSVGGTTKWANLCAAHDALDDATKARIEDLVVDYRFRDDIDFEAYFKASDGEALLADGTRIGLVHANPRTGRKAVWPNRGPDFVTRIVGWSQRDSDELMAELLDHATEERFVYEYHWAPGDSAFWLNTQTLHQREAFPAGDLRVLRHANVLGIADRFQTAAA